VIRSPGIASTQRADWKNLGRIPSRTVLTCAVDWTAMDPNLSDSLEEEVNELRSRVRRLEEALHSYGIVVQKGGTRPPAEYAKASPESAAISPSPVRAGK
jgi:hypothetical protein